jgi:NAD(P)-dependent dehydrogenase (short-subunit alcohol dehydrogenase family)
MLKGRSVFITGGRQGIGWACGKTVLERGGEVVIMDNAPQEEIDKAVAELNTFGKAWGIRGDVTEYESIKECMAFAVEKMGKVDGAVNSAGGGGGNNIFEEDDEPFKKTVRLCLFGVVDSMRAETKQMVKQGGGGAIVNISSINATVPYYTYAGYCAAKAGIEIASACSAMEAGKHNIRINSIEPGFTNTTLISIFTENKEIVNEVLDHSSLRRLGEAQDVANAAAFLLSDEASYITGSTIVVDGGQRWTGYPPVFKHLFPPGVFDQMYR